MSHSPGFLETTMIKINCNGILTRCLYSERDIIIVVIGTWLSQSDKGTLRRSIFALLSSEDTLAEINM